MISIMVVGHISKSSRPCQYFLALCIVCALGTYGYLSKYVLDDRNRQATAKVCFYWEKSALRPICKQVPVSCSRGNSFSSCRVLHSTNGRSWFNIQRLVLSGDIQLNPGPAKFPCKECGKSVRKNQNAVLCSECGFWIHAKCLSMSSSAFKYLLDRPTIDWICPVCSLPPLSDSFFKEKDSLAAEEGNSLNPSLLESNVNGFKINSPSPSHGTDNFSSDCVHPSDFFPQETKKHTNQFLELATILHRYSNNIKIAYLNVNCVAGFKFFEVKSLILEGAFDVFAQAETKIDGAFPDSQFYIKGYRMFRKDRNRFGGGLLVYIRRGLITQRINHLEGNYIESIALLVQPNKTSKRTLLLCTYKPPKVIKHMWEPEVNSMLLNASQRYDNLVIIGDLNCDILHLDKGSREGRALLDLMIEYKLTNLIREPTRMSATSSTLIDVILTNRPRSFLTSGTLDLGLSDHHLVFAVSRSHCPRTCPIKIVNRTFKNYDPERFRDDLHLIPFDTRHKTDTRLSETLHVH